MFKLEQFSLRRTSHWLARNVNWQLNAGEVWGVLGANGAGKSSLLLAMTGLLPKYQGHIHLQGRSVLSFSPRELARTLAYLPQDQQMDFPIRVRDWALLSRYPHQGLWAGITAADHRRVDEVFAQTHLSALANRWVSELSGGERQRLALAGILIQDTPWMLLDEPTNHLDIHFQMQLLPLLIEATQASGGGLVMSLHDVNLAAQFCTHCFLLLGDGEYRAGPLAEVLTAEHLSRLYSHPVNVWQSPMGLVFLPQRGQ